jgi:hypothetical protein
LTQQKQKRPKRKFQNFGQLGRSKPQSKMKLNMKNARGGYKR